MRLFIVSYDIADDDRRNDVAKCLLNWGRRLQFSVFEVLVSAMQHAEMSSAIDDIIDHRADQVLLIDLGAVDGAKSPITAIGRRYEKPVRKAIVV